VPIGKEDMRDIVSKHIRTPVVVTRDAGDGVKREMTHQEFAFPAAGSKHDLGHQPSDKVLIALRDTLVPLVARAPVPPIAFQPSQIDLIKQRLKTG
jgi:hypothetical protein